MKTIGHRLDRKKGNDFQDWIELWIKENYPDVLVHNQKSVSRMIKIRDKKTNELKDIWVSERNDILGCIDLFCVSESDANKRPLLIQATMDSSIGRKHLELLKIQWPLDYVTVQIWQKKKPTRVVIWDLVELGPFGRERREFMVVGEIIRRVFHDKQKAV